jgi:hypothetical protein
VWSSGGPRSEVAPCGGEVEEGPSLTGRRQAASNDPAMARVLSVSKQGLGTLTRGPRPL